MLLGACQLTSDDFQPALVESDTLRPDAGAPVPDVCPAGAACCDALPCAGDGICSGGSCVVPTPLADAGAPPCEGTDCTSAPPLPLTPSCDDGRQNGDEDGVDCGGSCSARCALGERCEEAVDCGGACPPCPAPASCVDGAQNGAESAVDCGGDACPRCGVGQTCGAASDCTSGVCAGGRCAAPSCVDQTRNGTETGTDCGGGCPQRCGTGVGCGTPLDCASGVCDGPCGPGLALCCQAPTCDDGVRNGGEPATDCGTPACGACALGRACFVDAECASGFCQGGVCRDPGTCNDGVQNGRETGTDCGGGTCPRCVDLSPCTQPSDCINNNCDFRGICISCGDNVTDGTETGVDCGGADPFCRRCNPGERCIVNGDCTDGSCFGGFC